MKSLRLNESSPITVTLMTLVAAFVLLPAMAFADARSEWCEKTENPEYFQSLASNPENNFSFDNESGWLRTGLCWWHSRFQRASYYLTVYRPDLPKPTTWQAIHILDRIQNIAGVVEIPGYKNFREFTQDWPKLLVNHLSMQEVDAIWRRWTWLRHGILKSGPTTTAREMSRKMDELYDYVVVQKKIAYTMLQIKGLMAHAWLVVGMAKTENGYDLRVVDSNFADEVLAVEYKRGDTSFKTFYSKDSPNPPSPGWTGASPAPLPKIGYQFYGDFVPHLLERGDFYYYERARARYCAGHQSKKPVRKILASVK